MAPGRPSCSLSPGNLGSQGSSPGPGVQVAFTGPPQQGNVHKLGHNVARGTERDGGCRRVLRIT